MLRQVASNRFSPNLSFIKPTPKKIGAPKEFNKDFQRQVWLRTVVTAVLSVATATKAQSTLVPTQLPTSSSHHSTRTHHPISRDNKQDFIKRALNRNHQL